MPRSVVAVDKVRPYVLRVTFDDGAVKLVDFTKHWVDLHGPIFQPLRDPDFFDQVTLPPDSETIEWPNGADLAAEYLYDIGDQVQSQENALSASGRV